MARPVKIGIEYFSLDVDIFEDEKVIPVSSEFGAKGECVIIRVLCAIYRNGYFAECSEAFKFKIAKQANLPESLISEVISGLVKWGFFDKAVFDSFGVLTSRRIQKNWKEATRKRVSKNELDYWILELPDNLRGFPAEETPLNTPESTQSKLNEIKEEITPLPPTGNEKEIPPVWKKDFNVYLTELREKYRILSSDKDWIIQQEKFNPGVNILKSIEKCCVNYWATEAGWKKKKGSKIKDIDWKATFANAVSLPQNRVYNERFQVANEQKENKSSKLQICER
jgi:hypothetical protein